MAGKAAHRFGSIIDPLGLIYKGKKNEVGPVELSPWQQYSMTGTPNSDAAQRQIDALQAAQQGQMRGNPLQMQIAENNLANAQSMEGNNAAIAAGLGDLGAASAGYRADAGNS